MIAIERCLRTEDKFESAWATRANGLPARAFPTGFNAFDDDPWIVRLVDFVKEVLAQDRVRIIGVCYGHQIVGRALGAKVARSESGEWEVSVCRVTQTEKGKELFGGKDSLVRIFIDPFSFFPSFLSFFLPLPLLLSFLLMLSLTNQQQKA